MTFKISATSCWYHFDEKNNKDYLIEKYPRLKEFGYKNGYITINSLEDLLRLKEAAYDESDEVENPLIIMGSEDSHQIEIYDDYRE